MSTVEQVAEWPHVRITVKHTIIGRESVQVVALPPTSHQVTHVSIDQAGAMVDAKMRASQQEHAAGLTGERERAMAAERRVVDVEATVSSLTADLRGAVEARQAAEAHLAALEATHDKYKRQANIDRRNYENRLELLEAARQLDRAEKERMRRHIAKVKAEKVALRTRGEQVIADMRRSRARREPNAGQASPPEPS